MKPNASMELMESIFENELLLANIFSWLDLDTVKIVRLVNTKWKSIAWKTFSEISLVSVHLNFGLNLADTLVQLDLRDRPFLIQWFDHGDDIITPPTDQLAPFKNFKLSLAIDHEVLVNDGRIEEAYVCLNQLILALWRPNGSLKHSVAFSRNMSTDLLHSIIEGCNSFSHVEIEAKDYAWFINTSQLPKMICHTIRINPTTFPLRIVSNVFSHYVSTKKIIFEDASLINLDTVVRAIIEEGEQFGKLEEIDVTIATKFDQLVALAGLRGLKRLRIRIDDSIIPENPIPALQECIARHAPTLEFLDLELIRSRVTSGLSFEAMEFLKLRKLYLEADLTFEEVGGQAVDIFYLNRAVETGTLRKLFPELRKIEIVEPPDTSHPILKTDNISELGVKCSIQVLCNRVKRG